MAYTTIVFNAKDAWLRFVYGFKINLITEEVSIEYKNDQGGFTTRGIQLNGKQLRQIKHLMMESRFKDVVNGKWKEVKSQFALDPNIWELEMLSDDGHPLIKIDNGFGEFEDPLPVVELVEYVLQLMTYGDLGWRAF